MDKKAMGKRIRRDLRPVGWWLILYYLILNVSVIATAMVEMMAQTLRSIVSGNWSEVELTDEILNSGWGYLLGGAVGLVILLAWKDREFWREEIFARSRRMTPGTFFSLLAVFLGCQLVGSLLAAVIESILNCFGLSAQAALESASGSAESLSMFLYMAIWAPISEELLFRGLLQQTLRPYGKRLAIFGSAFLFGIYHGNLVQTPYAFLVGLVLGYAASEYSIIWSIVLHMFNNMVLADGYSRLTAGFPEEVSSGILFAILTVCAIAGAVILILKRKTIRERLGHGRMHGKVLVCFFTSPGVLVLEILMIASMILMIQ